MKTVSTKQVKAVLKEHFPEWLSGSCYCGIEILTYEIWLEHITSLLEDDDGTQLR